MHINTLLQSLESETFGKAFDNKIARTTEYECQGGLRMWLTELLFCIKNERPIRNDAQTDEIIALAQQPIIVFGSIHVFME